MKFGIELSRCAEACLRLLFPSNCASCSQLLQLEEFALCSRCRSNLQKLKLTPSEERIRISLTHGDEGWALYRYEEVVKDILHKIKFVRRRDLLGLFTEEISHFLQRRPQLSSYDCLIPIPLDPRRRLEREFNQSGLLAEKIHRFSGIRLRRRTLVKKRPTLSQSLLGRKARALNLNRVFHVTRAEKIKGRSILLVDDIFTTGATIDEAARALKAAGALRVGFLALARAQVN